MKKSGLFISGLILFIIFYGCPQPTESSNNNGKTPSAPSQTEIQFTNTGNFPVAVYSTPSRLADFIVAEVEPNTSSKPIQWIPDVSGYSFYLSYIIYVNGIQLPLIPTGDKGIITPRIDSEKTTIILPTLENIFTDKNEILTTAPYLSIRNNGGYPLRLQKGDTVIERADYPYSLVNHNETGLYKVEAGSASVYALRINLTSYSLPLASFEPGHVYTLIYNSGTPAIDSDTVITVNNLSSGSAGDLPAPVELEANEISASSIKISWEPAAGAVYYEIYRGATVSGVFSPVSGKNITVTNYTDSGLNNSIINYYKVRAYSADYSKSSLLSAPVSIDPKLPETPGKPLVVPGDGRLTISWTAAARAGEYEVYVGTGVSPPYSPAQTVTGLTATVTGLTNGATYYVWIRAKNSIGVSEFSAAEIAIPSAITSVPPAPNAPILTPKDGELAVSWGPVATAASYEVWLNTSNNSGTATCYASDSTVTSITITNLTNETLYYVWIRAKNHIGAGGFSPAASGKPTKNGSLSISIGFNYGQITITGNNGSNAISKSGSNGRPVNLALKANGYSSVIWYVDGDTTNKIIDTGAGITLSAANYPVQSHSITFTGTKDGVLYSEAIPFTVFD